MISALPAALVEIPRSKLTPRLRRNYLPILENGDALTATEFMLRFEEMSELKRAELIDGIVYLGTPVRSDIHGEPHAQIAGWLGSYLVKTRHVGAATNCTLLMTERDVSQPDCVLRIETAKGGKSFVDHNGFLNGSPELVAEIACSRASLDAHRKLELYQRMRVQEYLLCLMEIGEVHWFQRNGDSYTSLKSDHNGVLRSRVFPGLWLDTKALFAGDAAKLLATLQRGLKSKEHAAFLKR